MTRGTGGRCRVRDIGAVGRVVFKVGTSLVTEDRSLSIAKIDALAEQIARFAAAGGTPVVVTSGAIAAGSARLKLPRRPRTIPEKQAAAAVGQSYLMAAWEQAFRHHGLQVAQVLLTGGDLADRRRFTNAQNTLGALLEYGVIPVINENDTVAVDEIRVGDNDTLSATVAVLVGADLLVILSDIEGLYTADPRRDPQAALLPTVRGVDAALLESAGGSSSAVGTGGMRTKLIAARRASDFGIPMAIASGQDPENIGRLLSGQAVGTVFLPAGRRLAGKKHWIRHTLAPAGDILVDAGATRALVRGGKSLLPAGVTGTRGEFAAGDPVRIVGPDGKEIARGLTRYAAAEIDGIKGLTTERLRGRGCHREDEVVHRDELVVTAAAADAAKA
ncbi:MAG TPA: glutamate 5-kinase [Candidatus Methanoperedens sp.]|nr:glutamate 5-kinase [Candidatus Methanoperedens sp.]